jgi:hypothetical protein
MNFRIYLRVDPSDYFIGDYLTLDGKPLEHHASDTIVTSVQSPTNGSCEVSSSQPVGNGASGCCGVRGMTLTEEVEATANMGVAVAKTQEEEWNEMPPLVSLDLPSSIPSASSAESFTQERRATPSPLKINSSVIIPTAVDADTNAVAESSYASATATTVVAPAASSSYEATAISAIKVANSSCGNGRDELVGVDDLGLSTCPDDTTATASVIEGKPGGSDEERSERPVVASAEDVTRAGLRGRNGDEDKENMKERENAYREDVIKRIIADGCSEAYHTLLHNKKGIYKSPTHTMVCVIPYCHVMFVN